MKEDLQHWEVFRCTHPWLLTGRGIGFFVARMPGWINAVSLSVVAPSGEDSCLEQNAAFIISDSICNHHRHQVTQIMLFLCLLLLFFLHFSYHWTPADTGTILSVVFPSVFNSFKKLLGKLCGVIKKNGKLSE